MPDTALVRIGELSRRSGVSRELLRAWERRYDLLHPTRSAGGLRLYSDRDLDRVRAMQHHLASGLAAAEAARLAAADEAVQPAAAAFAPEEARAELTAAFAGFDEARAHALLDSLFAAATQDAALSTVIVPYLHELGSRWERGEATVAEEHFASAVMRGRLLGLARDWGRGLGPRALLACAPLELHDLGLIAFGLALRARGWRIGYLGQDSPLDSVASAARAFAPRFVVISSVDPRRFRAVADELRELASAVTLCLAGAGAEQANLDLDVITLGGDPVEEAERLTQITNSRESR